jgi:HAD superfamily hydrolase (TIGR01509 family)
MPTIEAVTFDVGDTLTDLREGLPDYEARGRARAAVVYDILAASAGIRLPDRPDFSAQLARAIEDHYAEAVDRQQGVTIGETLRWFLEREGLRVSADLLETCADQWCLAGPHTEPGRQRALLRLGARETLAALAARGLKLGVISNSIQPARYLDGVLERYGLKGFFTATVYSSEAGVAKPHPAIFQAALRALQAPPERTVHVGDRLLNDVAGAQAVGMAAILIEVPQRVEFDRDITPDARIRELPELPAALDALPVR